jgi:hypothetical protein
VSAYIAESVTARIRHDQLRELLAGMAADAGPPDTEDRRWARSALGLD